MSDTENTPALPGKEEKPVPAQPVATAEETPTGNGETELVEHVNEKPKAETSTSEKVEEPESKNGAEVESKETPMEVEVADKKEKPATEVKAAVPVTPEKSTPTKKAETDGDAEEDEESSSEEEPPLGLLERPVEVSGKRERKKTERLSMAGAFTPTDKKLEVPEGSGKKLGDIPIVEHFITKSGSDDCKILHRIIYGRPGTVSMVKRNVRKFCGFTFSEDSADYTKKKNNLAKVPMVELKRVAGILDQEKNGSREEIADRCMKFLLNPQDSGKPIPAKKPKGVKGGPQKGKKRKRKSKKGEGDEDGEGEEDDGDEDVSGDSMKADSDVEEEGEKSGGEDFDDADSDVEKPKKKKPRLETPKKKKPTKTATAKPKKEKKDKPKKEKKKAASKKKKAASSGDESSDDDEPLAKKSKKGPPTNDEIKELVKNILDGANLEEVTMKTVCRQVYTKFPEYDLTDRKDFIKSTVKQLIS